MKICDHWQDCGVQGGGCCAAKHYEKPSFGMCNSNCKHRVIDGVLQVIIKSEPQARTQIQLARQYARAELTHATQGPASESDAAARLAICMACDHRAVEYKGMTDAGGVGWCTKCGCGNNPRAMLTVKVTLAGVECPLKKWGQVDGTGASISSVAQSVAGVARSIIHKATGL